MAHGVFVITSFEAVCADALHTHSTYTAKIRLEMSTQDGVVTDKLCSTTGVMELDKSVIWIVGLLVAVFTQLDVHFHSVVRHNEHSAWR